MASITTTRFLCAVAACITAGSIAQAAGVPACSYQTSLLATWDSVGPPDPGQPQSPANGWTYRRSDMGRALLQGFMVNGYPVTGWGSPDQAFGIPIVGPRWSPTPARNQIPVFRRAPSFEGLFFHPGDGAIDVIAELKPQATVFAMGLQIKAEHLGTASPTFVVTARIEKAGGGIVVLIPPTTVNSLAAARTLNAPSNLFPQTLTAADRLVVVGNNGGSPFEDWANVNATVLLEGPPLITTQPGNASSCVRGGAILRVHTAGAVSFRWRKDGFNIPGATTSVLTFSNASAGDDGLYDCVVTNTCGSVTTVPARLSICIGDFNCDGGTDGADVDSFFIAWEGGEAGADVNADGGIDGADVDTFFIAWEGGGC